MREPVRTSAPSWDDKMQPAICAHSGWGREELVLLPNIEVPVFDPGSSQIIWLGPWGRFLIFALTPLRQLGIGHGTDRFGALNAVGTL